MAAYYKLYGLLFVFLNCFEPSYMLESSEIIFLDEPKTDKPCYVPNEKGILTTKVYMPHWSEPLHWYNIAWSTNPNENGTGTWFVYGIDCITSSIKDPPCTNWSKEYIYTENLIYCELGVKDMRFLDETAGLYAFVIDERTGVILATSSAKARFNVNRECPLPIPTNDIPLTKETDPDSSASSTHTPSSSPSPSSEGGYLSQEWSILTPHMEEIISWFTTVKFLVHSCMYIVTAHIISIIHGSNFRAIVKDIQLFCPDVYDYTREWFRRLWRRVLQQYYYLLSLSPLNYVTSEGGYLSQKWSILTSHMEEIISRFTTVKFLVHVAACTLLQPIISIIHGSISKRSSKTYNCSAQMSTITPMVQKTMETGPTTVL